MDQRRGESSSFSPSFNDPEHDYGGSSSAGFKRRNSWNKSLRDSDSSSYIAEPVSESGIPMTRPPAHPLQDNGPQPLPSASFGRPKYFSSTSVDSTVSATPTDGEDEIHLTSIPASSSPDRPRVSRPAGHYGERRRMGTIKAVSRNIRRASMRVVNLAGVTLEDRPIRLEDDEDAPKPPAEEEPLPLETPMPRERLRGRTFGVFGPKSRVRRAMLDVLLWPWTEPIILVLILMNAVVLAIQSHRSVFKTSREDGFFKSWEDYALFILFVIFTLEIFARVLVTGLILDPETRMTDFAALKRSILATESRLHNTFAPDSAQAVVAVDAAEVRHAYPPGSISDLPKIAPRMDQHSSSGVGGHAMERSQVYGSKTSRFTNASTISSHPFQIAIAQQKNLSEQNLPYLRHSWNRIDFLAVVCFWIMFVLAVTGSETNPNRHLYIFRALSVLRVSRLLAVTSGTTTIMRSLKIAGPLLVRVAVFVLFAMILFSIVGVQAFAGSFRRTCQLVMPDGSSNLDLGQSCGGQIDPISLNATGYVELSGSTTTSPKGFICPKDQICQEASTNPHSNVQSFDNIFLGALQVLIIAGANGWAPIMYQMMDADFYAASIFFVVCIVILNFWLLNLFVAVITNTFSTIRAETKKSAFGASNSAPIIDEKAEEWNLAAAENRHRKRSLIRDWYQRTQIGWILLILIDLIVQATRTAWSSPEKLAFLDNFELIATVFFDVEMVWRVAGYLPNWRQFNEKRQNYLDLFLVVITTIIQIPQIHHWRFYPWFTIFQLLRFYRVILAVPTMRPLLLRVFGNMNGLFNMTLFLLITNILGGLIAVQLFRGDVDAENTMNFGETYAAFLAMYQVFSSENWTDVLYLVVDAEAPFQQLLIAVLFFVSWFLFANFILLQMFIAVINENFEVAEEHKRSKQFDAYLRRAEPESTRVNLLDRWNPYRFVKAAPKSIAVDNMPSGLVLPLKKAIVQENRGRRQERSISQLPLEQEKQGGIAGTLRKILDLDYQNESVPMHSLRNMRRDSTTNRASMDEEPDSQLDYVPPNALPDPGVEEANDALHEEEAKRVDFIEAHPTFDKPFWILSNQNPLRKICQKLVRPAGGPRTYGVPPSPVAETFFGLIIMTAVVGGIVVGAIASPMFRREYYQAHGIVNYTWFDIADIAFGAVLILELLVKVIADGFIFTPNAYLLGVWNVIDLLILMALLVNMVSTIVVAGGVSRLTRSLKAFRALRLITFFPWMRDTFHSVLFAGARSLIEAALLALLYMIPYAIWGLNLFSGLMYTCNDSNSQGRSDCINEYINQPLDGSDLGFLAPRSWDRPSPSTTFSFDSFGSSLLILFEVVSFEGWIDVMSFAMNLSGRDQQPSLNTTQYNSLFFLTYDLLGAVIILTLFISIIIGNFSSRSGMALLTEEQKRWIDLQKLIRRQRPSKRPKERPRTLWRAWCFDRAVEKNGWWSKVMTALYVVHIIAMMTQTFTSGGTVNRIRELLFLTLTTIYFIDIVVRVCGLGVRPFCANGWNLFDVFVVSGSFGTTVPIVMGPQGFDIQQLQKLFLVCIAFKLVQKNNSLNQLFKTSVASLPAILRLLALWVTLFVFFAIINVEVFGLTRWGRAETHQTNYRQVSNALIMLIFQSVGEGWNQYMHDFTVTYPYCTNSSAAEPDSDCGSIAWSYFLFIAWNLLSMYIFVNMFTGVVVENFSYVFQLNNARGSINRQEMRGFKKAWSKYDVDGSGYLRKIDIVPFLATLSGIFNVRIYSREFAVDRIMQGSKALADDPRDWYSRRDVVGDVDLKKLAGILRRIDVREVAQRRRVYNRLWHEAMISVEPGKGISFTNMLLLLAHYKIINDESALKFEETLDRRATTEHVTDRVNYDRVRSLLKMFTCRRRFLAWKESKALAARHDNQEIPAIVVDDIPHTPKHPSWDITQAQRDSRGFILDDDSPAASPIRPAWSPEGSPNPSAPASPIMDSRIRRSDFSTMSGDYSRFSHGRRDSAALGDRSPQQVLSTLDSSIWGEMMHEGLDED